MRNPLFPLLGLISLQIFSLIKECKSRDAEIVADKIVQSRFNYYFELLHPDRCYKGYDKEVEDLFLESETFCKKQGIIRIDCYVSCFLKSIGIFTNKKITAEEDNPPTKSKSQNQQLKVEINRKILTDWLNIFFPKSIKSVNLIKAGFIKCARDFPQPLPTNYKGDCSSVQELLDCVVDIFFACVDKKKDQDEEETSVKKLPAEKKQGKSKASKTITTTTTIKTTTIAPPESVKKSPPPLVNVRALPVVLTALTKLDLPNVVGGLI